VNGAQLLASIEPMITFSVRRLRATHPSSRFIEVDELFAQAWHVAVLCLERFDPAQGVTFRTFAERRVWGHLRDFLSAENKYRVRHLQLEHLTLGDTETPWEPPARGLGTLERLLRRERLTIARQSIRKLPKVQRAVMCDSLAGETYVNTAKRLGYHASYIPLVKREAIKRLRRMEQVKALFS
jgi:RNA polymerase sigma factor (sigma-70 family)